MTDIQIDHGSVVSMRELSQNTSGVIAEIVRKGEPACLTKRGQFIAVILPLQPGRLEAELMANLADYLPNPDAHTTDGDTAAVTLGLNLDALRSDDPAPRRRRRRSS